MKKKKILKFLTLFLSFTGVAFTFSFSTNIKLEKNILINDELKDEKIIERKIVKYSPLNVGNEIDDEITNINEVKLLLNYEVEDFETINENKKFFTNKNNEFINLIKEKINYIKDSKISELSPIVWFYFENKNDKDKFLNFIKNDNSIFKIINFTYEAKPTVFIDDKNCPDKKCIEKFREAFLNFDSKTEKKLDIVYRYPVSFTKNNLNIINAEGLYLSDNENNKIGI
ncbi:hypothetical protein, partial [[Mycoplasma] collis]|uniref:hypothetical protein n=1 Tax=[Mycoplasma] collis TaxID=2127 RepID=UPI00051B4C87